MNKRLFVICLLLVFALVTTQCSPVSTQTPIEPTAVQTEPTKTESPIEPTAVQAEPTKVEEGIATPTQGLPLALESTTGVEYVKKDQINNGQPIKIVLWDWFDVRANYYQEKATEYSKVYPNVTFEVTILPWDEFWTKLTASLPAGQGPDVFQFFNGYHTAVVGNGFAAPYPAELFDQDFMAKHWVGMKEKQYHDNQGNIAYLPVGEMASAIYVNKAMWEAAGLTEKDYPKTWDELSAVATKLTKFDSSGNMDVAGFAFNGNDSAPWSMWFDMIYQQGRYFFTADGKGCQLDSPEAKAALDKMLSFYDAKVNTRDFLANTEAFGTQKAAMAYAFTWFSGFLKGTYPDVEFFTIPTPTLAGTDSPSRGYFNYEAGLVVSSKTAPDRQQVAFDFLHWLFGDEKNLTDMAILMDVAPPYDLTFQEPAILERKTTADTISVIGYKTFPGEIAWALESQLAQYFDQALSAGNSAEQILQDTQNACVQAMSTNNFYIVQRNYLHNDLMIPGQP